MMIVTNKYDQAENENVLTKDASSDRKTDTSHEDGERDDERILPTGHG